MKRIAYLLHRFPEVTDTFIKREIRSLQKAGTDVQVISVWKPGLSDTTSKNLVEWASETEFLLPRSVLSILVITVRWLFRAPVKLLATLRLAFSTSRPGLRGHIYQMAYFLEAIIAADVLRRNRVGHVHNHIGDQSGTVTMLAANLANISYSITFHGWPVFFDAHNSRIKEKVLRSEFTRAISYFCQSQLMMFSDCDDSTKFKIVHCGLTLAKYHFRLPRADVRVIFCAARLSAEKGHAYLLEALKIVVELGFDIEIRLAGDGPRRQYLTKLAQELGIAKRVHFLGSLTEDEVVSELERSDLFVLPSFVEGLPVSVMEAMAVGVPVIATNVGGTSELVQSGVTGLLVRPSDAGAIAEGIIAMVKDQEFRIRAAKLGRERVEDEFDLAKECARLNHSFLESCPDRVPH